MLLNAPTCPLGASSRIQLLHKNSGNWLPRHRERVTSLIVHDRLEPATLLPWPPGTAISSPMPLMMCTLERARIGAGSRRAPHYLKPCSHTLHRGVRQETFSKERIRLSCAHRLLHTIGARQSHAFSGMGVLMSVEHLAERTTEQHFSRKM
ncbi:hypothetical protein D9M72_511940 [compost metagenome]